ncbi:hypothetical protein HanIR_Chr09g0441001 [Helianthus annuus]|nr:hypothetical protein HanIR_Chr09g0441001 [Helianthus annuus]
MARMMIKHVSDTFDGFKVTRKRSDTKISKVVFGSHYKRVEGSYEQSYTSRERETETTYIVD